MKIGPRGIRFPIDIQRPAQCDDTYGIELKAMKYQSDSLILGEDYVKDSTGTMGLGDLPDPQPICPARLCNTTPIMERLWRIALSDIESNIVEADGRRYFGAGQAFGLTVFTRDISLAGMLGLNKFYPDEMLSSMRFCRDLRRKVGLRLSQPYVLDAIDAPWVQTDHPTEGELQREWGTASVARRTDDVVWMWCTADLIQQHKLHDQWDWFYQTGCAFFEIFYDPFFDATDGLYRGQACFIDIHYLPHGKATGYPEDWDAQDCILVKALSTNCLYFAALQAMSHAAAQLGKADEASTWQARADALRQAIRHNLLHEAGYLSYYRDKSGTLTSRREALGSALAVLLGIVTGNDTHLALGGYPATERGVPLFEPFFENDRWYHNNSSWPFVDTFFLKAMELADGQSYVALNAALLAHSCMGEGTFHEVIDYRTREAKGSARQLWTAAAFIDVCERAGQEIIV